MPILDDSSILFSKSFYHSVFSQTSNICDAYHKAVSLVRNKFGNGEASKFVILIWDIEKRKPSNGHICKIFGPLKEGPIELFSKS
jgi:hypothetical protein